MGIDDILAVHRDRIRRLAAGHGASNLRVIGSVARGDAGPGSDVELLVDMAAGTNLLDIVAIQQDLQGLLGRKVLVVTEAAISPSRREQVIREAVRL